MAEIISADRERAEQWLKAELSGLFIPDKTLDSLAQAFAEVREARDLAWGTAAGVVMDSSGPFDPEMGIRHVVDRTRRFCSTEQARIERDGEIVAAMRDDADALDDPSAPMVSESLARVYFWADRIAASKGEAL